MKKAILIALTLTLALLSACGGSGGAPGSAPQEAEPVTLNVCVDLREADGSAVSSLLLSVPGTGTEFTLLTQTIPPEGAQRENALQRVRTELLAGKGPDVFLCDTALPRLDGGVLFPFPCQVMENRVFLPLDGYIDTARYMDWDKLLPKIMDAGKNDEGQLLLPLGYELRMYTADKSQGGQPPPAEELCVSMPLYDLLGELADYDRDQLALTEEELLENCREQIAALKEQTEPPVQLTYITDGAFMVMDGARPLPLDLKDTEYWMLSGPNNSGGLTASVTCFAGINRNTKHPDEAFRVVDFLMSEQNLASSSVYNQALSVHGDLCSESLPWHGRYMSPGNFAEFQGLRDEINTVKFYTPLDSLVYGAWDMNASEDELRELVHETYVKMSMYLAES